MRLAVIFRGSAVSQDVLPFSGAPDRESDGVRGEVWIVQRALSLPAELVLPRSPLHSRGVLILECSAVPPPVRDQQHYSR